MFCTHFLVCNCQKLFGLEEVSVPFKVGCSSKERARARARGNNLSSASQRSCCKKHLKWMKHLKCAPHVFSCYGGLPDPPGEGSEWKIHTNPSPPSPLVLCRAAAAESGEVWFLLGVVSLSPPLFPLDPLPTKQVSPVSAEEAAPGARRC